MSEKKEYVSSKTMARELDLSIRTIQEWCKQKKIKTAYKISGDWRVERSIWEEFKQRILTQAS